MADRETVLRLRIDNSQGKSALQEIVVAEKSVGDAAAKAAQESKNADASRVKSTREANSQIKEMTGGLYKNIAELQKGMEKAFTFPKSEVQSLEQVINRLQESIAKHYRTFSESPPGQKQDLAAHQIGIVQEKMRTVGLSEELIAQASTVRLSQEQAAKSLANTQIAEDGRVLRMVEASNAAASHSNAEMERSRREQAEKTASEQISLSDKVANNQIKNDQRVGQSARELLAASHRAAAEAGTSWKGTAVSDDGTRYNDYMHQFGLPATTKLAKKTGYTQEVEALRQQIAGSAATGQDTSIYLEQVRALRQQLNQRDQEIRTAKSNGVPAPARTGSRLPSGAADDGLHFDNASTDRLQDGVRSDAVQQQALSRALTSKTKIDNRAKTLMEAAQQYHAASQEYDERFNAQNKTASEELNMTKASNVMLAAKSRMQSLSQRASDQEKQQAEAFLLQARSVRPVQVVKPAARPDYSEPGDEIKPTVEGIMRVSTAYEGAEAREAVTRATEKPGSRELNVHEEDKTNDSGSGFEITDPAAVKTVTETPGAKEWTALTAAHERMAVISRGEAKKAVEAGEAAYVRHAERMSDEGHDQQLVMASKQLQELRAFLGSGKRPQVTTSIPSTPRNNNLLTQMIRREEPRGNEALDEWLETGGVSPGWDRSSRRPASEMSELQSMEAAFKQLEDTASEARGKLQKEKKRTGRNFGMTEEQVASRNKAQEEDVRYHEKRLSAAIPAMAEVIYKLSESDRAQLKGNYRSDAAIKEELKKLGEVPDPESFVTGRRPTFSNAAEWAPMKKLITSLQGREEAGSAGPAQGPKHEDYTNSRLDEYAGDVDALRQKGMSEREIAQRVLGAVKAIPEADSHFAHLAWDKEAQEKANKRRADIFVEKSQDLPSKIMLSGLVSDVNLGKIHDDALARLQARPERASARYTTAERTERAQAQEGYDTVAAEKVKRLLESNSHSSAALSRMLDSALQTFKVDEDPVTGVMSDKTKSQNQAQMALITRAMEEAQKTETLAAQLEKTRATNRAIEKKNQEEGNYVPQPRVHVDDAGVSHTITSAQSNEFGQTRVSGTSGPGDRPELNLGAGRQIGSKTRMGRTGQELKKSAADIRLEISSYTAGPERYDETHKLDQMTMAEEAAKSARRAYEQKRHTAYVTSLQAGKHSMTLEEFEAPYDLEYASKPEKSAYSTDQNPLTNKVYKQVPTNDYEEVIRQAEAGYVPFNLEEARALSEANVERITKKNSRGEGVPSAAEAEMPALVVEPRVRPKKEAPKRKRSDWQPKLSPAPVLPEMTGKAAPAAAEEEAAYVHVEPKPRVELSPKESAAFTARLNKEAEEKTRQAVKPEVIGAGSIGDAGTAGVDRKGNLRYVATPLSPEGDNKPVVTAAQDREASDIAARLVAAGKPEPESADLFHYLPDKQRARAIEQLAVSGGASTAARTRAALESGRAYVESLKAARELDRGSKRVGSVSYQRLASQNEEVLYGTPRAISHNAPEMTARGDKYGVAIEHLESLLTNVESAFRGAGGDPSNDPLPRTPRNQGADSILARREEEKAAELDTTKSVKEVDAQFREVERAFYTADRARTNRDPKRNVGKTPEEILARERNDSDNLRGLLKQYRTAVKAFGAFLNRITKEQHDELEKNHPGYENVGAIIQAQQVDAETKPRSTRDTPRVLLDDRDFDRAKEITGISGMGGLADGASSRDYLVQRMGTSDLDVLRKNLINSGVVSMLQNKAVAEHPGEFGSTVRRSALETFARGKSPELAAKAKDELKGYNDKLREYVKQAALTVTSEQLVAVTNNVDMEIAKVVRARTGLDHAIGRQLSQDIRVGDAKQAEEQERAAKAFDLSQDFTSRRSVAPLLDISRLGQLYDESSLNIAGLVSAPQLPGAVAIRQDAQRELSDATSTHEQAKIAEQEAQAELKQLEAKLSTIKGKSKKAVGLRTAAADQVGESRLILLGAQTELSFAATVKREAQAALDRLPTASQTVDQDRVEEYKGKRGEHDELAAMLQSKLVESSTAKQLLRDVIGARSLEMNPVDPDTGLISVGISHAASDRADLLERALQEREALDAAKERESQLHNQRLKLDEAKAKTAEHLRQDLKTKPEFKIEVPGGDTRVLTHQEDNLLDATRTSVAQHIDKVGQAERQGPAGTRTKQVGSATKLTKLAKELEDARSAAEYNLALFDANPTAFYEEARTAAGETALQNMLAKRDRFSTPGQDKINAGVTDEMRQKATERGRSEYVEVTREELVRLTTPNLERISAASKSGSVPGRAVPIMPVKKVSTAPSLMGRSLQAELADVKNLPAIPAFEKSEPAQQQITTAVNEAVTVLERAASNNNHAAAEAERLRRVTARAAAGAEAPKSTGHETQPERETARYERMWSMFAAPIGRDLGLTPTDKGHSVFSFESRGSKTFGPDTEDMPEPKPTTFVLADPMAASANRRGASRAAGAAKDAAAPRDFGYTPTGHGASAWDYEVQGASTFGPDTQEVQSRARTFFPEDPRLVEQAPKVKPPEMPRLLASAAAGAAPPPPPPPKKPTTFHSMDDDPEIRRLQELTVEYQGLAEENARIAIAISRANTESEVAKLNLTKAVTQQRMEKTRKIQEAIGKGANLDSPKARMVVQDIAYSEQRNEYLAEPTEEKHAGLMATRRGHLGERINAPEVYGYDAKKRSVDELRKLVKEEDLIRAESLQNSVQFKENEYKSDRANVVDLRDYYENRLAAARRGTREYNQAFSELLKIDQSEFGRQKAVDVARQREILLPAQRLLRQGAAGRSIGTAMTSTGQGLTMGLTAPLIGGIGYSIKSATDEEAEFARVKETFSSQFSPGMAGKAEQDKIESELLKMQSTSPVKMKELAHIAAVGGQLGISKDEVVDFTHTVMQMGVAILGIDANHAAAEMAKLKNTMQMTEGAKSIREIANVVSELHSSKNVSASAQDLLNFGLRLSGVGHVIGMTMPDVLALGAGLASTGSKAEQGGTALQRTIIMMASSMANSQDQLDKLKKMGKTAGLDPDKVGGATLYEHQFATVAGRTDEAFRQEFKDDPRRAITDFIVGLKHATEAQKNIFNVLDTIGGKGIKQSRTVTTLLQASGYTGYDEAAAAAKAANDKTNHIDPKTGYVDDSLGEKFAIQMGTTKAQLDILVGFAKTTATLFGKDFLPVITGDVIPAADKMLKIVGDIAFAFHGLSQTDKDMIFWGAMMVGAIGPVTSAFGHGTTIIGEWMRAVGTVKALRTGTVTVQDLMMQNFEFSNVGQLSKERSAAKAAEEAAAGLSNPAQTLREVSAARKEASAGAKVVSTGESILKDAANVGDIVGDGFIMRRGKSVAGVAKEVIEVGEESARASSKVKTLGDAFKESFRNTSGLTKLAEEGSSVTGMFGRMLDKIVLIGPAISMAFAAGLPAVAKFAGALAPVVVVLAAAGAAAFLIFKDWELLKGKGGASEANDNTAKNARDYRNTVTGGGEMLKDRITRQDVGHEIAQLKNAFNQVKQGKGFGFDRSEKLANVLAADDYKGTVMTFEDSQKRYAKLKADYKTLGDRIATLKVAGEGYSREAMALEPAGPIGQKVALAADVELANKSAHDCQHRAKVIVQSTTHAFDDLFQTKDAQGKITAKSVAEGLNKAGVMQSYRPGMPVKPGDLLYSTTLDPKGDAGHVQVVDSKGDRRDQYGKNQFSPGNFQYLFDPDYALAHLKKPGDVANANGSSGLDEAAFAAKKKSAKDDHLVALQIKQSMAADSLKGEEDDLVKDYEQTGNLASLEQAQAKLKQYRDAKISTARAKNATATDGKLESAQAELAKEVQGASDEYDTSIKELNIRIAKAKEGRAYAKKHGQLERAGIDISERGTSLSEIYGRTPDLGTRQQILNKQKQNAQASYANSNNIANEEMRHSVAEDKTKKEEALQAQITAHKQAQNKLARETAVISAQQYELDQAVRQVSLDRLNVQREMVVADAGEAHNTADRLANLLEQEGIQVKILEQKLAIDKASLTPGVAANAQASYDLGIENIEAEKRRFLFDATIKDMRTQSDLMREQASLTDDTTKRVKLLADARANDLEIAYKTLDPLEQQLMKLQQTKQAEEDLRVQKREETSRDFAQGAIRQDKGKVYSALQGKYEMTQTGDEQQRSSSIDDYVATATDALKNKLLTSQQSIDMAVQLQDKTKDWQYATKPNFDRIQELGRAGLNERLKEEQIKLDDTPTFRKDSVYKQDLKSIESDPGLKALGLTREAVDEFKSKFKKESHDLVNEFTNNLKSGMSNAGEGLIESMLSGGKKKNGIKTFFDEIKREGERALAGLLEKEVEKKLTELGGTVFGHKKKDPTHDPGMSGTIHGSIGQGGKVDANGGDLISGISGAVSGVASAIPGGDKVSTIAAVIGQVSSMFGKKNASKAAGGNADTVHTMQVTTLNVANATGLGGGAGLNAKPGTPGSAAGGGISGAIGSIGGVADMIPGGQAAGGILSVVASIGSLFGFADGGLPQVGKVSMFGERGPELGMPMHSMNVFSNSDSRSLAPLLLDAGLISPKAAFALGVKSPPLQSPGLPSPFSRGGYGMDENAGIGSSIGQLADAIKGINGGDTVNAHATFTGPVHTDVDLKSAGKTFASTMNRARRVRG